MNHIFEKFCIYFVQYKYCQFSGALSLDPTGGLTASPDRVPFKWGRMISRNSKGVESISLRNADIDLMYNNN